MVSTQLDTRFYYHRLTPIGFKPYEPIPLSTRSVLLEAEQHHVAWEQIPGVRMIKLEYQGKVQFFHTQVSATTTSLATYCTDDKKSTKGLLRHHGISVPKGYFLIQEDDTPEIFKAAFDSLKKPVVTKPFDANQGSGVTVGITTYEEYEQGLQVAFATAQSSNKAALIEEMFMGKEYRVLATQDKVIGITERMPANVVGDGTSTIAALIEKKNDDPRRGDDFIHTGLKKIVIDAEVERHLEQQNLTLKSIPEKGERILLRFNSNLSTGGDSIDLTDEVHPSVKEISMQVMRAIPGLAWGGIDFMSSDIYAEQTEDSYCIVEVNDSPGFFMHDFPYEGSSRHAAREFLYLMYPELRKSKQN